MRIKNLLAHNAYTIAIAITILITITSLISLKGIPSLSIKISNSDKIAHCFAYLTLSLSWFFATQHHLKKSKHKIILISILITYGIIIEALQSGLTTYRQADFYDVLANSLGILLALILFPKLNLWFNSK